MDDIEAMNDPQIRENMKTAVRAAMMSLLHQSASKWHEYDESWLKVDCLGCGKHGSILNLGFGGDALYLQCAAANTANIPMTVIEVHKWIDDHPETYVSDSELAARHRARANSG